MGAPNANHDRLEQFCGSWLGTVTVPPSPQLPEGMTAESRVQTTRELGGWFVLMNYEQKQHGGILYTARGVIGYDDAQSQYMFYWFDSEGWNPGAPAVGQWDGDRIVFEHASSMGHSRMTFDFSGNDGYQFLMDASQDGQQWSRLMEESFTPALCSARL